MKTTSESSAQQAHILHIIGQQVRYYREQKGWSQEQLAFESGLHRTYIGGVERGERNITIVNLIRIKDTLDIPLQYLYPEPR